MVVVVVVVERIIFSSKSALHKVSLKKPKIERKKEKKYEYERTKKNIP